MTEVDELKTAGTGEGSVGHIEFSTAQQEKVQELIDSAYRRAYEKATHVRGGGEEMELLKREVDSLKGHKKSSAILRAISKFNVVDAEEVAELVGRRVNMDNDGRLNVTAKGEGAGGAPREVGIDEYVTEWLTERPHHLRNSSSTGSGSRSAVFGEGKKGYDLTDPASWRTMPRKDLDEMLSEGVNIRGTQGQTYKFRDVKNPFHEARKRKFSSGG